MSARPGTEFPNPCPVCGSTDEHAEFRARLNGMGCTVCPHPGEPGHGTGCCCAGLSKPLSACTTAQLTGGVSLSSVSPPSLEERVAALEARMAPVTLTFQTWEPLTPEQVAELRSSISEVAASYEFKVLSPPPLEDRVAALEEAVARLVQDGTDEAFTRRLKRVWPEFERWLRLRQMRGRVDWRSTGR